MKGHSVTILLSLASLILASIASPGSQKPPQFPLRPQPLTTELPKYPAIARASCTQGAVGLLVNVDSTGNVTATEILYGHPLLRRSAEAAARAWIFDASKDDSIGRREVVRFVFRILPFETPEKKLKPVWSGKTDVEIRSHPIN